MREQPEAEPGQVSEHDAADGTGGTPRDEEHESGSLRRGRFLVLAVVICALVAGGGYLLFARGGGTTQSEGSTRSEGSTQSRGSGGSNSDTLSGTPALAAAGCITPALKPAVFRDFTSRVTKLPGVPLAIRHSNDGRYTFVAVPNGISVLRDTGGVALTPVRRVPVQGVAQVIQGMVVNDDRYLIAATGNGATVMNLPALEQHGAPLVLGRMTSPRGSEALTALLSRDGKYLFVLQKSGAVAVFNFGLVVRSKFATAHFVGSIPLSGQPTGMQLSPAGNWLYVTSSGRTPGRVPDPGTLSVIDVHKAETDPSAAVKTKVYAGCGPARILAEGNVVWVTARDGNALLAFSASQLVLNPSHALVADMPIGPAPIGITLLKPGQLVVADSNQSDPNRQPGYLAIVNISRALAGKPGLIGVIPASGQPHVFVRIEQAGTLQVIDQVTDQVLVFSIASLP